MAVIALAYVLGAACGGGSYDGGSPTTPGGSTSGGGVGATITIRSDGTMQPSEVRIAPGERVRFINQDGVSTSRRRIRISFTRIALQPTFRSWPPGTA